VIRRESDPATFAARVGPWLLQREPEHNVLLGVLSKLIAPRHEFEMPVYLASIEQNDVVAGCAFRTPPYKLGLTRMPGGVANALADDVGEVYASLPAVLGREEDATRFATAWAALRGVAWTIGMRQRIHALEHLIVPDAVAPGHLRLPAGERRLVVDWVEAFAAESGVGGSPSAVLADVLLAGDDLFFWDHGGPRAMVASPGFTPNGARVGYVYTPPADRGRGYATAAVAELSRRTLAAGRRFCMLYTNVENPISNAIYARLGYRPVVDVVDVDFTPAP